MTTKATPTTLPGVAVISRTGLRYRLRDGGLPTDPMFCVQSEAVWLQHKTRKDFDADNCISVVEDFDALTAEQYAEQVTRHTAMIAEESELKAQSLAEYRAAGGVTADAGFDVSVEDDKEDKAEDDKAEEAYTSKRPSAFARAKSRATRGRGATR